MSDANPQKDSSATTSTPGRACGPWLPTPAATAAALGAVVAAHVLAKPRESRWERALGVLGMLARSALTFSFWAFLLAAMAAWVVAPEWVVAAPDYWWGRLGILLFAGGVGAMLGASFARR